jgi:hypothetical protein
MGAALKYVLDLRHSLVSVHQFVSQLATCRGSSPSSVQKSKGELSRAAVEVADAVVRGYDLPKLYFDARASTQPLLNPFSASLWLLDVFRELADAVPLCAEDCFESCAGLSAPDQRERWQACAARATLTVVEVVAGSDAEVACMFSRLASSYGAWAPVHAQQESGKPWPSSPLSPRAVGGLSEGLPQERRFVVSWRGGVSYVVEKEGRFTLLAGSRLRPGPVLPSSKETYIRRWQMVEELGLIPLDPGGQFRTAKCDLVFDNPSQVASLVLAAETGGPTRLICQMTGKTYLELTATAHQSDPVEPVNPERQAAVTAATGSVLPRPNADTEEVIRLTPGYRTIGHLPRKS